jgi:arylsulfatase A-like enzyme
MNRNGLAVVLGGLLTIAVLFGGTVEAAEIDDRLSAIPLPISTDHGDPLGTPSTRRPNVVLIFADDLGYGELSIQGSSDVPTPNIDSLAQNGIRFTQGYVTHPVCAPSRAGLLAGQYQHRFGFEHNPGPARSVEPDFGIEPSVTTLAERLKTLGYATGMVGKWHLGYRAECRPSANGFDEFFGFLGGGHNYLPEKRKPGRRPILKNDEPIDEPAYLTDAFGREAVDFIMRHEKEPFFLYLSFNAVHMPLEATVEDLQKYDAIHDRRRRTYAAMTEAMDRAVGNVLGALRKLNLEEDTLVFFVSDNGGPTRQTTSSNLPLRDYKGQMYEGGIRVPFLIQWKNHLPSGITYEKPVSTLDVHPTAVAATGEKINPQWKLDGVDLLPHLKGENQNKPHETLFWRAGARHAVLHGDWKLVLEKDVSKPQLFHIADDIGEASDLAGQNQKKVEELQELFDQWSGQMESPRWIRRTGSKKLQKAEMRERVKQRIMSKLTEELELDQDTEAKFLLVMNEFDVKQEELRKNRGRTMKQMKEELARETSDPAALSALIEQFKQNDRDMTETRVQRLDALSKILNEEQIAEMIAIAPKIEQGIRELVAEAKARKKEHKRRMKDGEEIPQDVERGRKF